MTPSAIRRRAVARNEIERSPKRILAILPVLFLTARQMVSHLDDRNDNASAVAGAVLLPGRTSGGFGNARRGWQFRKRFAIGLLRGTAYSPVAQLVEQAALTAGSLVRVRPGEPSSKGLAGNGQPLFLPKTSGQHPGQHRANFDGVA